MPIYDLACPQCAAQHSDQYFKVAPTPDTMPVCPECGTRLSIQIGLATPLTHTFAEDRPYIDHNIRPDGKPQRITSWGQRKRLMREFNLEERGAKRGMPGAWA